MDISNSYLKDVSSAIPISRIAFYAGLLFMTISICAASVVLLPVLLKLLSQKMEVDGHSFDYYGIFWGLSAILFLVFVLLLYRDVTIISMDFTTDFYHKKYYKYFFPFVFAFFGVFCTPVAIYFGVKFVFPTPSVYLFPAKLLCCCNEKHARILVTSLTLWFNLAASVFLLGHGFITLFAFTMAPFVVAVNVMLLVLAFMCLTYIMALVFTMCASLGTRKCFRSNADCCATVRAAILIPFLLAIICFVLMGALSGQFVNNATQPNSFNSIIKSLFTPVFLAAASFGLRRLISVWLHWSPGNVDGNAVNPLHGRMYNGYQAIDNVVIVCDE